MDSDQLQQLREEMRRAFGQNRRRELIERYGIDAVLDTAWKRVIVASTGNTG